MRVRAERYASIRRREPLPDLPRSTSRIVTVVCRVAESEATVAPNPAEPHRAPYPLRVRRPASNLRARRDLDTWLRIQAVPEARAERMVNPGSREAPMCEPRPQNATQVD
jgi:hypothetical protein